MSKWAKSDLIKIAEADDLHIAPFREDATTYGTLTWIWSVVVDGSFYVRAYNGKLSCWYQVAMRQKAGRIIVVGMIKEVFFEPVEGSSNDRNDQIDRIDEAYRAKYRRSPYLAPMIGDRARAATVKVVPRTPPTPG